MTRIVFFKVIDEDSGKRVIGHCTAYLVNRWDSQLFDTQRLHEMEKEKTEIYDNYFN